MSLPMTAPVTRVPAWRAWTALAARLVLGGVFVVAGALKLPDPAASVRAVRAYELLPEAVVPAVGYGLPVLEVALGVLLIVGVAVRLATVAAGVLLVLFVIGVVSAWARGLTIDCGCFGGGGTVAAGDTRYGSEVLRDAGLIAVAAFLALWPQSRLALLDGYTDHTEHHVDYPDDPTDDHRPADNDEEQP